MIYTLVSQIRGTDAPRVVELITTSPAAILAHLTKYRSRPGHISQGKSYFVVRRRLQ